MAVVATIKYVWMDAQAHTVMFCYAAPCCAVPCFGLVYLLTEIDF